MAIVPRISVVKPNQEVIRYTGTNLSDIQQAIDENSIGGFTQITVQQGVFTGTSPVEVPATVFVLIMPGAEFDNPISDTFVKASNTSESSPNVADFNALRQTTGGGSGVVFKIETDDTINQNSLSGDVELGVNVGSDKNSILLDSKKSGTFDTLTVDPQSVVLRKSGELSSLSMDNNSVLLKKVGDIENIQFSANSILGRFGTSNLSNIQIAEDTILGRLKGNSFEDISVTQNTLLANVGSSGLDVVNLNSQNLKDQFELQASDIAEGKFKTTGSSSLYEFDNNLTVGNDLTMGGTLTVDLIDGNTGSNSPLRLKSPNSIFLTAGMDTGLSDLSILRIKGKQNIGPSISLGGSKNSKYKRYIRVDSCEEFLIVTDSSDISGPSGDGFIISEEGYIDFPIRDQDPQDPPDGYIRLYARVDDTGTNSSYTDGRFLAITSGGQREDFDPD